MKDTSFYLTLLSFFLQSFNPLTPNDHYSGRTAPLTSKHFILYIYSRNTCTEYFKHGIYSPFFFSLQNAVCFIIVTYLVPILSTFYIQSVLKFKKNNSGAKRLSKKRITKTSKKGLRMWSTDKLTFLVRNKGNAHAHNFVGSDFSLLPILKTFAHFTRSLQATRNA